jgi:hypothetical protein
LFEAKVKNYKRFSDDKSGSRNCTEVWLIFLILPVGGFEDVNILDGFGRLQPIRQCFPDSCPNAKDAGISQIFADILTRISG